MYLRSWPKLIPTSLLILGSVWILSMGLVSCGGPINSTPKQHKKPQQKKTDVASGTTSTSGQGGSKSSGPSSPDFSVDPGGIPNVGGYSCYINSVLQIFAKLYPSPQKGIGQNILDKIRDDKASVTSEEAKQFYEILWAAGEDQKSSLERGKQEDALQAFAILFALNFFDTPKKNLGEDYDRLEQLKKWAREMFDAERVYQKIIMDYPYIEDTYTSASNGEDKPLKKATVLSMLSLNLPISGAPSMQGLFRDYLASQAGLDCQFVLGKEYKKATLTKKLGNLDKLPNGILPIQILRFQPGQTKKVDTAIQKPHQLTIKKEKIVDGTSDVNGTLVGFILHEGPSVQGGHYIAYIKRGNNWKSYNDIRRPIVRNETSTQVDEKAKKAYLYFYQIH